MNGKLSPVHMLLLVILLFLFLLINNLHILGGTRHYQICDAAGYFDLPVAVLDNWRWLFETESRPPFPIMISVIFLAMFGLNQNVVILGMNSFFLLVMMFFFLDLAQRLIDDRAAAVLALINLVLFPIIFAHSRIIMADISLTAVVVATYWSVVRSEFFHRRKLSVMTGVVVGIGLLTKPLFPVFVLPVFLYSLFRGQARAESVPSERPPSVLMNMSLAIVIGSLISSIYYILNIHALFVHMGLNMPISSRELHPDFRYFLVSQWKEGIGPYFMSLLACSLVSLAVTRTAKLKHMTLLILWIILPYLFLSFLSVRICRYFMPSLPAVAILTGSILLSLQGWRKWTVFSILTAISLGQFFFLSYSPWARTVYPVMRERLYVRTPPSSEVLLTDYFLHAGLYQAEPYDWEAPRALARIKECLDHPPVVLMINCPTQLKAGIQIEAILQRYRIEAILDTAECDWTYTDDLRDLLEGEPPPDMFVVGDYPKFGELCRNADYNLARLCFRASDFDLVDRFQLRNGVNISLLVRRPAACTFNRDARTGSPQESLSLLIDAGGDDDRFFNRGDAIRTGLDEELQSPEVDVPSTFFQTARSGDFDYVIKRPEGHYLLELWFIDDEDPANEQRTFDIYLNGELIFDDLSILSLTKPGVPLKLSVQATPLGCPELELDGYIHLVFHSLTGPARVSAIIIRPSVGGWDLASDRTNERKKLNHKEHREGTEIAKNIKRGSRNTNPVRSRSRVPTC